MILSILIFFIIFNMGIYVAFLIAKLYTVIKKYYVKLSGENLKIFFNETVFYTNIFFL